MSRKPEKYIQIGKEAKSLRAWAIQYGQNINTVYSRHRRLEEGAKITPEQVVGKVDMFRQKKKPVKRPAVANIVKPRAHKFEGSSMMLSFSRRSL